MGIIVELKAIQGHESGKVFSYSNVSSVFLGRNSECGIVCPEATVSRYHCLLDIVPPSVKVRDFGSLNGTYVNDVLIGKRKKDQTIEEAQKATALIVDLHDKDKLSLGKDCVFQLSIKSDLKCCRCGKMVGLVKDDYKLDSNNHFCIACYNEKQKQLPVIKPSNKDNVNLGNNPSFPGYKAIRLLGHGGMGEVWLAEKTDDGKTYAIKRILPKAAASPKAQDEFLREAALANQLYHQNIVTQHSYHQKGSDIFLVQEYCNGGSVDDYMMSSKRLFPVVDAVKCIIQTLEGLSYAHSANIQIQLPNGERRSVHGIVHRDLKPSNIFIQKKDGLVIYKVADFGLAKSFELAGLSGLTQAGQVGGTPAFMPRQQVLDYRCAKPEVDVWAAAASLYFMLTGTYPKFNGKKDPWLAAVTDAAVPILKRNNTIPKRLAALIDDALIDSPAIKYKTAKAFQAELITIFKEIG